MQKKKKKSRQENNRQLEQQSMSVKTTIQSAILIRLSILCLYILCKKKSNFVSPPFYFKSFEVLMSPFSFFASIGQTSSCYSNLTHISLHTPLFGLFLLSLTITHCYFQTWVKFNPKRASHFNCFFSFQNLIKPQIGKEEKKKKKIDIWFYFFYIK